MRWPWSGPAAGVVVGRPGMPVPGAVGERRERVAQPLVARPPEAGRLALAGLDRHRGLAGVAGERVTVRVAGAAITDLCQQRRGSDRAVRRLEQREEDLAVAATVYSLSLHDAVNARTGRSGRRRVRRGDHRGGTSGRATDSAPTGPCGEGSTGSRVVWLRRGAAARPVAVGSRSSRHGGRRSMMLIAWHSCSSSTRTSPCASGGTRVSPISRILATSRSRSTSGSYA